jgi:hypothetical protein
MLASAAVGIVIGGRGILQPLAIDDELVKPLARLHVERHSPDSGWVALHRALAASQPVISPATKTCRAFGAAMVKVMGSACACAASAIDRPQMYRRKRRMANAMKSFDSRCYQRAWPAPAKHVELRASRV